MSRVYKCCQCNKEITTIITRVFDRDGSDYEKEVNFKQVPHNAIVFEIGTDWVGYGGMEDTDQIMCPNCRKFPFKSDEIQCYEYLKVVCFRK